jgi:hypothetical protein
MEALCRAPTSRNELYFRALALARADDRLYRNKYHCKGRAKDRDHQEPEDALNPSASSVALAIGVVAHRAPGANARVEDLGELVANISARADIPLVPARGMLKTTQEVNLELPTLSALWAALPSKIAEPNDDCRILCGFRIV